MNLKYISDKSGKITGVIVPISEWNKLKNKYAEIDKVEIPKWQKDEVGKRLEEYQKDGDLALDFEKMINELEQDF